MASLDSILDAVTAMLELERDLGTRTLECDRALLVAPAAASPKQEAKGASPQPSVPPPDHSPVPPPEQAVRRSAEPKADSRSVVPAPPVPASPASAIPASAAPLDFVFLHHAPLSGTAAEIMVKAVGALGKTSATAPVVTDLPIPKAKVYAILGERSRRKFMPQVPGAPGMWVKSPAGRDTLITYSPADDIAIHTRVTPAVQAIKRRFWEALKTLPGRARL